MMNKIKIFDSTLRDGAQSAGVSFSVKDKLKIARALDNIGIDYIEAGNPGSNAKDLEFFNIIKNMTFKNSTLTAFGSTRRKNITVEEDENIQALLSAGTSTVAIFGKTWDMHVTDIINTTLEENLKMISETIVFLKSKNKEVIFDAEHFYDGYKANSYYALKTIKYAVEAGADWVVLCDTNGGTFPEEIYNITKKASEMFTVKIGIHSHNDCGMAVANSITAVKAGATQVQGTYIGFGERCGNANLSTIIPNLQLKMGMKCIPKDKLYNLTSTARYIAEITNIILDSKLPYVGLNAFSHKGGMHIDGVSKVHHSFEHVSPDVVGNERRFLISEVSGRSTILGKIKKIDNQIVKESSEVSEIINKIKELEFEGYQFESAEGSLELMIRKYINKYEQYYKIEYFKIVVDQGNENCNNHCSAVIKVNVDNKEEITAAEGNGPVNALDKALRKGLEVFYPSLKDMHLSDYKVKVINAEETTAAKVRVLIESTDGYEIWNTVGVSTNIIEASFIALADSIEYKLIKDNE